jgi:hypothetical protein
MSEFVPDEEIVSTECDHLFHKKCCEEWLRKSRTCPVCRTDIPSTLDMDETEDEEEGDQVQERPETNVDLLFPSFHRRELSTFFTLIRRN